MQGLFFFTLLAVAATVSANEYVRPTNSDCVSISSGDVSLFPKEFMATGQVTDKEAATEVGIYHLQSIS